MSRRRRSGLLALAATVAVLCAAAGAWAASASGPVADCNAHGQLTQHYSPAQLRNGLATMPADIKEYTDCYDVLQRALLTELGQSPAAAGKPASSSSGGSFLPTPVIVVLVALILAAVTFGAIAVRRRRGAGAGDEP
jgi:hypothetical protein